MKKRIALYAFAIIAFVIGTSEIMTGGGKAGYTNSPNEGNCTNCHSDFAVNSGGGSVTISTNIPNNQYVPNQTYQITVTVAQANISLFGMDCEALINSNKNNAGTLIITNASTQLKSITVAGVSRKNVVHTANGGAASNSKAFTFNWKAPSSDVGNITFYASGNAANGDHTDAGDFIYTASQLITADPNTGLASTEKNLTFNIYPNPVKDHFSITLTTPENNTSATIRLYTVNGSLAKELIVQELNPGSNTLEVGREYLSSGIYLLQVSNGAAVEYKKLVLE